MSGCERRAKRLAPRNEDPGPVRQTEVHVADRRALCQAVWRVRVSEAHPGPEAVAGRGFQAPFPFEAGQFFLVGGPGYLRRPVWPCRPAPDGFEFLVTTGVSDFDAWLVSRAPGDTLSLVGPLGRGYPSPQKGERWLLLAESAACVGPLLSLLECVVAVDAEVVLLTGASGAARLFPRGLLPPAVELRVTTLDGSQGVRGRVLDALPAIIDWPDHVAAVGSVQMYRGLKEVAATAPGPKRTAWVLLHESPIVCGVGACRTCCVDLEHGRALVCRDGPVFDLSALILDENRVDGEAVDD